MVAGVRGKSLVGGVARVAAYGAVVSGAAVLVAGFSGREPLGSISDIVGAALTGLGLIGDWQRRKAERSPLEEVWWREADNGLMVKNGSPVPIRHLTLLATITDCFDPSRPHPIFRLDPIDRTRWPVRQPVGAAAASGTAQYVRPAGSDPHTTQMRASCSMLEPGGEWSIDVPDDLQGTWFITGELHYSNHQDVRWTVDKLGRRISHPDGDDLPQSTC